jgi:diacylglycerol kinase (ATP)
MAFWVGNTPLGISLMIFGLGLVLLVEVLNSAIEAIVDRIGLERNDLSGRAKDLGSLAVLMSIVLCGAIWVGVILSGA